MIIFLDYIDSGSSLLLQVLYSLAPFFKSNLLDLTRKRRLLYLFQSQVLLLLQALGVVLSDNQEDVADIAAETQ